MASSTIRRILLALTVISLLSMGTLLYFLYKSFNEVHSVDVNFRKSFSIIEELRNDSRTLTAIAYKSTIDMLDDASLNAFQDIIEKRRGTIARPSTALVAPGMRQPFLRLLDTLHLTDEERRIFHDAYETSQSLTTAEREAMRLTAELNVDSMTSPEVRAIVKQALQMITGPEYTAGISRIHQDLDLLAQNMSTRMDETSLALKKRAALLIIATCATFFISLICFSLMGYMQDQNSVGRNAKSSNLHLFMYILGLLLITVIVPNALSYEDERRFMIDALEKRQALLCSEVYNELHLRMEQVLDLSRLVASRQPVRVYVARSHTPDFTPALRAAGQDVLAELTLNYSDISAALLFNREGHVLNAPQTPAAGLEHLRLPPDVLERVLAGQTFVTPIDNPATGGERMVALVPVLDPAHNHIVIGGLLSLMDTSNGFRLWEGRLAAEEHMDIFIISKNLDRVISSREGSSAENPSTQHTAAAALIRQGAAGVQYYTDSYGVERIGYFMPSPDIGWTVGVSSAHLAVTSQVRDMLIRMTIFEVISMLAAVLLISLLMQRMTKNLRTANEHMDNIINSAEMFTLDSDVTGGTFAHSAQWCRFWRYPGEPQAGTKPVAFMLERMHPDGLRAFLGARQDKKLGESFSIEYQVRTCDEQWRWCRQIGRVEQVDEHGKPSRLISVGYDITSQKQAEEHETVYKQHLETLVAERTAELEAQRNRAEAASQAKTAFLSTVNHEIRTPMNAIVGFVHIFDRRNLTNTQIEYLEKIKLSAGALLGIINDVLDISKIEAGKLELDCIPFHVHGLLDTVCSIVDFAAFEKGLDLRVQVDGDVPPVFRGDPKRISQILLNLMNNAVKFTSSGGITLAVSLADPPQREGDTLMLAFRVTDTGIGISEEQIARLFRPFVQADSSVTRRFGGTGLGLAISKQLVEIMGGSIGVTSYPGQGSTFHCTLRLGVVDDVDADLVVAHLPGESSPEELASLRSLAGMEALVVEDNEINQEIARALLEEYGIVVDVAANGQEALDMATVKQYHCIFMDMQMPVMDGIQATCSLRSLGATAEASRAPDPLLAWLSKMPIIAMTANAMDDDRQRCLDAGMNDHIGKPIDVQTLKRCLLRWLARQH